jgi:hypothetical protein
MTLLMFFVRRVDYNMRQMYDALTSRYTFACPVRGETRVQLSSFRRLERMAGTSHPVVYRVRFSCVCGDEHPGLVSHDELDWAPLGLHSGRFVNLMTSRIEDVAVELGDLAARRIQAGEWPWSFFCYPEDRPRPIFPSSFLLLAAADRVAVAVRCPVCARMSVNLVSHDHVDLPFVNDREVGVVEHVFDGDATALLYEFQSFLGSGEFDARRRHL